MIGLRTHRRRRDATAELPERLEALAAAVELAEGRLPEDELAFARQIIDKARGRLRHGTGHTLVALVGATGCGKSSVANALAGNDVATTGVRRPTTATTLALIWGDDDAGALLDWLEVPNRHRVGTDADLDGLVLLDVPDHDSVAVSHRLEMERIAEQADLLVWVTDPEKYADEAMHHYLRLLTHHGAVTVMVLNKTDRLDKRELDACVGDLKRLLDADGLPDATVLALSALTGHGVGDLERHLRQVVGAQRAVLERLVADVTTAADTLAGHLGPAESPRLDTVAVDRLRHDLAEACGIEVVAHAAGLDYRRQAQRRTGWPPIRWVQRLRPDPLRRLHLGPQSAGRSSLPAPSGAQTVRAQAAIRTVADTAAHGLPEPWPGLLRAAASPEPAVLHDRLDLAVAGAVRGRQIEPPNWWGAIGALQFVLLVAALVGGVWLTLLAANNWLRLPEFTTPTLWGIPVPTALLIVGLAAGWLLALLARRLAGIGSRRRSRAVRREAADAVADVAEELILTPLRAEVARRDDLRSELLRAGAVNLSA